MENEKFCKNCGARNQPYAAFCADCGESFIPPATSAPEPPATQPEEPLGDEERGKYAGLSSASLSAPPEEHLGEPSYPSPPEEPSRGFRKRYILYGVLALLLLSLVAGAISASQQIANRSIASPTAQASVAATTPQASASVAARVAPSASPTTQPASSSLPDYTSRLNTAGLGAGLTTVSPFQRVTANGRQAYVGTLTENGKTYNAQVYPMNSYSEALAFKDQLISGYTSQGYTAYNPGTTDASLNLWYGLSGQTLVGVSALPSSQIGTPITLVMTATVQQ
ncbi:MAG: zinc ribbon domain-containing protein [Halobacteriota archaeon]